MSPDDQRIAIAEACGWGNIIKNTQDEWHFLTTNELVGLRGSTMCGRNIRLFPDGLHHAIPNYLNDLNAMHEAEKVLLREGPESDMYLDYVMNVTLASPAALSNHATAAQRAEAFLRTIGKWRNS